MYNIETRIKIAEIKGLLKMAEDDIYRIRKSLALDNIENIDKELEPINKIITNIRARSKNVLIEEDEYI